MTDKIYSFSIPIIPDYTHYKYITAYEGPIRDHIFLRAEHLLRMIANIHSGEVTIVFQFLYDPRFVKRPQDRMRLNLLAGTTKQISSVLVDQVIRYGPLAEFYKIEENSNPFKDWDIFHATTEIIRLEEGIKPSSPSGLDIHKLNKFIPEMYYCIHPFKPRAENDFMTFDKACSFLNEPAMLEIMVQPISQFTELEIQYREIVNLIAVNSFSKDDYIIDSDQLDPLQALYEPKLPGEREVRAKDPIADEFLKSHRELNRNLRQPQLKFNIKIWATTQESSHVLASTAAECAFEEGSYKLLDYERGSDWFDQSLKSSNNLVPFIGACDRHIWDSYHKKGLFPLAHMTSVDEFKGMFRFPIAGYSTPRCLWKSTDYHRKIEAEGGVYIGNALGMGNDFEAEEIKPGYLGQYLDVFDNFHVPVSMPFNLLSKHIFVAGVPGSGKTTAVFNLLVQLYGRGIPFLVIEPGKTEYRQLKLLQDHPDPSVKKLAKELRIYTPGKDDVSPFRFNPFQYPEGITEVEHISQLLTCFEASMPLGGPLQALLGEAVEFVYEKKKKGKIIHRNSVEYPNMNELVDAARSIMDTKGYAGEVRSNLAAAIDVRLSSLTRLSIGNIFDCRQCMPSISDLLRYPTIIEVQNLNPYQACLLILFLLSAIWEEIRVARQYSKEPKHVTVIEEAHNIVGRSDQARPSEDFADPKAYAAEFVVRMLAEIRAMGEGIVIADQLPSAVASSVVKNTGTKLAHRLVSLVDREDLGGAMLLDKSQMEEIARLEPGQAYYYTEGLYAPRQVAGFNAHKFLGLDQKVLPDNHDLLSAIEWEDWFLELKKGRYAYIVQSLAGLCNGFERSLKNAANGLKYYLDDFQQFKKMSEKGNVNVYLSTLRQDVIKTKKDLIGVYLTFANFVRSIPENIKEHLDERDLDEYNRIYLLYQKDIKPRVLKMDNSLENLEKEIRTLILKEGLYGVERNK